ncbi:MAG: hypothetical protein K0S75_4 [Clostridia bacterium]|jgi:uroporphyrinogen decarboxylase|nr:hypothetical protein [Clostridia bacterium]
MTRKERVIKALQHEETDKVPYFCEFTDQARENMEAYFGTSSFEKDWGLHLHYTQYWGWPTEVQDQPEHFKDEFGAVWNRSGADKDIGVIDHPLILDLEDYHYEFPEVNEKRLRKEYEELIATKEDKFTIAGIGFSMFERSWSLMGMENVLMNMIMCPDELENLYDRICDYNLKIIDIILEYDVDGVYFGDDWGQQKGLIMGPAHWRRFIKPRMKRMYDRVKSKGKYVVQHSCGDLHEIFPDLIEIGLDCYQTFQPEIYDITSIKKQYGKNLTIWGGISTQQLLPYATPDKVKEETLRIMEIMSQGGGYIAAPTHAVPFDVPPQNIEAMMEVFINQKH